MQKFFAFFCNQNRLVKELRLAGIQTIAAANQFLERRFLPDLNRRFIVAPATAADLHRPIPREVNLAEVLSLEERRTVAADLRQYMTGLGSLLRIRRGKLNDSRAERVASQAPEMLPLETMGAIWLPETGKAWGQSRSGVEYRQIRTWRLVAQRLAP